jgi:hypothetical protein
VADNEDIIQRVVLEGIDGVVALLQEMAETGSEAFDKLKAAADKFTGKKVTDESDKAKASLGALGEAGSQVFEHLKGAVGEFAPILSALAPVFGTIREAAASFVEALSGLSIVSTVITALSAAFQSLPGTLRSVASGAAEVFVELAGSASKAIAVLGAVVAAAIGVTIGLFELVKGAAEAGEQLEQLALKLGTTPDKAAATQFAFNALGVSSEELGRVVTRLATRIEGVWEKMITGASEASKAFAGAMDITGLAFKTAAEKVSAAFAAMGSAIAQSAEKVRAANLNVLSSTNAFASAQLAVRGAALGVQSAELAVIDAETNLKNLREGGVASAHEIEKAELALEQAEHAVEAARQKQLDAAVAAELAELNLAKARREAADEARKQAEQVQELARKNAQNALDFREQQAALQKAAHEAGTEVAKQAGIMVVRGGQVAPVFKTVEQQLADITLRAKELDVLNGKGFQSLVNGMRVFSSAAPTLDSTLTALAEKFASMTDETQKVALATRLLGRGVTGAMIEALSRGSSGLESFKKQAEAAGLGLGGLTHDARDFHNAMERFQADLVGAKNKFLLAFGPGLTPILNGLSKLIEDNQETIKRWGQNLANFIVPIIRDFIALLKGDQVSADNQWMVTIANVFRAAGVVIAFAWNNVIKPVFQGIEIVASAVATVINSVFGTQVTSTVVEFSAAFLVLVGVLKPVGLVIAGLVAAFGGWAVAIAAVVVLVGTLVAAFAIENWDTIVATSKKVWDSLVSGWNDTIKFITDGITGAWAFIADSTVGFFQRQWDTIQWYIDKVKAGWDWLKSNLTGNLFGGGGGGGAGGEGGAAPGFASGGHVHGPGTGTSDSIAAWLSNGEFVVSAAAVRSVGVNFLQMLNNLRAPGFAMGGLVGLPQAPRMGFSGAGGSRGSNTLNLSIDGHNFNGLTAPDKTFRSLCDYAAMAKASSTGRQAGWNR